MQGEQVEITTYRADSYDGVTRKPTVEFGDTLEGDLVRRDFTVNAMALRVPSQKLVDPSGGVEDLLDLRLPGPLRGRREAIRALLPDPVRFIEDHAVDRLAELSQLSDRQLADIGIKRSDIPRVVVGEPIDGYRIRVPGLKGWTPSTASNELVSVSYAVIT